MTFAGQLSNVGFVGALVVHSSAGEYQRHQKCVYFSSTTNNSDYFLEEYIKEKLLAGLGRCMRQSK